MLRNSGWLRAGTLVALLLVLAPPAAAQPAPACCADQMPGFVFGFADLSGWLGDTMGTAVTCEYSAPHRRCPAERVDRTGFLAQEHQHPDVHRWIDALGAHSARKGGVERRRDRSVGRGRLHHLDRTFAFENYWLR